MLNCKTIDIEDALQAALNDAGYTACAIPVPTTLRNGQIVIRRTGGAQQQYVQDVHRVVFDCYESDEASAMALACNLTKTLRALEGETIGGVPVYRSSIITLPYDNPDPDNHNHARATLFAEIVTRVIHE